MNNTISFNFVVKAFNQHEDVITSGEKNTTTTNKQTTLVTITGPSRMPRDYLGFSPKWYSRRARLSARIGSHTVLALVTLKPLSRHFSTLLSLKKEQFGHASNWRNMIWLQERLSAYLFVHQRYQGTDDKRQVRKTHRRKNWAQGFATRRRELHNYILSH